MAASRGGRPKTTRIVANSPTASRDEVAQVAYELFQRRGGVHGHDLEDWVEAERIVRARRRRS